MDLYLDRRTAAVVNVGVGTAKTEVYVGRGGRLPDGISDAEVSRLRDAGVNVLEGPEPPPVVAPPTAPAEIPEVNRIPASVALGANPEVGPDGQFVSPPPPANAGPAPISLLALGQPLVGPNVSPPASYDPGDYSADEVIAYVRANPDAAAAVLTAELAGKARKTVIEAATPVSG